MRPHVSLLFACGLALLLSGLASANSDGSSVSSSAAQESGSDAASSSVAQETSLDAASSSADQENGPDAASSSVADAAPSISSDDASTKATPSSSAISSMAESSASIASDDPSSPTPTSTPSASPSSSAEGETSGSLASLASGGSMDSPVRGDPIVPASKTPTKPQTATIPASTPLLLSALNGGKPNYLCLDATEADMLKAMRPVGMTMQDTPTANCAIYTTYSLETFAEPAVFGFGFAKDLVYFSVNMAKPDTFMASYFRRGPPVAGSRSVFNVAAEASRVKNGSPIFHFQPSSANSTSPSGTIRDDNSNHINLKPNFPARQGQLGQGGVSPFTFSGANNPTVWTWSAYSA